MINNNNKDSNKRKDLMSNQKPKNKNKTEKALVKLSAEVANDRKLLKATLKHSAKTGGRDFGLGPTSPSYQYVRAIINPEHAGLGVGVPDEYSYPTMKYQSVNENSLGSTGVGALNAFDNAGTSTVIVTPDPRFHTFISQSSLAATIWDAVTYVHDSGRLRRCEASAGGRLVGRIFNENYVAATNPSGLATAAIGTAWSTTIPAPEYVTSGLTANIVNSSVSSGTFMGCCGDSGSAAVGIPVVVSDFVEATLHCNSVAGIAVTMTLTGSTNAGATVSTAAMAMANWGSTATLSISFGAAVVRWTSVTFTFSGVAGNATVINSATLRLSTAAFAMIGTGSLPQSGRVFKSFPVPEYATYADGSITAHRCVSQSIWLQYDGGTLNDNGRIVGTTITSRTSPWNKGQSFCDISSIAALRGAYDGQLPKGTYGIWIPQTADDIKFRTFNQDWDWDSPYLIAQMFNPTAAGQQVRSRVVSNWEFQTHSNLFQLTASVVDPQQIAIAHLVLANFPDFMENTFHFDKIKEFLKDIGGKLLKNLPQLGAALGTAVGGPQGAVIGNQAGALAKDVISLF